MLEITKIIQNKHAHPVITQMLHLDVRDDLPLRMCSCLIRRSKQSYGDDESCQKLRGIPDVPSQRITDLETAIRQLRQLSCILDSCTIAASYEVSQAQKALLLMPRTACPGSAQCQKISPASVGQKTRITQRQELFYAIEPSRSNDQAPRTLLQ